MGVDITPVSPVAAPLPDPGRPVDTRRVDPGLVLSIASVAPALAITAWLLAAYPLVYGGHATALLALPAFALVAALIWVAARRLPAVPGATWSAVLGTGAVAVAFAGLNGVLASGHVVLRRDSAVYALLGRYIADTGGLTIPAQLHYIGGHADQVVTTTAPALYPAGDTLTAQFMSGTALTLAPFGWTGPGWGAILLVPALVGGCSVLAFGGLAGRLLGARWAPVAALALALVQPMLLTFRSTYSEPLAQLLLLAALCLLLDAVAGGHRGLAGLAGLLVGLGLLVRIDAVRDIALLVPVIGWLALRRNPCWWPVALGAAVGTAYGVVDALGPAYAYVHDLRSLVRMAAYGGVLLAVLCAVAVLAGRRWLPDRPAPPWLGTAAATVVAAGLLVLASRPLWYVGHGTGGGARFIESLQRSQGLPVDGNHNYAEQSVRWVSWYAGWPALVLAGVALALLVRYAVLARTDPVSGQPASRWVLGLGLPVISALSVLWSPGITPDHPWADRRLVPTVLPVVAVLAVWSVAAAYGRAQRRGWGGRVLAVGLLLVLVPPLAGSRYLALSRTEAGEPAATEAACAAFRPGEVALLVDARARQEWTAVLREACRVPAFGVPGDGTDDVATRAQVDDVVARVRAAGGTPVLVAQSGDPLPTLTDRPQRQVVQLDTHEQRRELTHPATGLTPLSVQLWRADPV